MLCELCQLYFSEENYKIHMDNKCHIITGPNPSIQYESEDKFIEFYNKISTFEGIYKSRIENNKARIIASQPLIQRYQREIEKGYYDEDIIEAKVWIKKLCGQNKKKGESNKKMLDLIKHVQEMQQIALCHMKPQKKSARSAINTL